MMRSVRIWVSDFDPTVPALDLGADLLGGSWGEGSPWRYEPAYWGIPDGAEARDGGGYLDYWVELTIDEAREVDARFRAEAISRFANAGGWLESSFSVMDRALAPESPFRKFTVVAYEWEHGLPDV